MVSRDTLDRGFLIALKASIVCYLTMAYARMLVNGTLEMDAAVWAKFAVGILSATPIVISLTEFAAHIVREISALDSEVRKSADEALHAAQGVLN